RRGDHDARALPVGARLASPVATAGAAPRRPLRRRGLPPVRARARGGDSRARRDAVRARDGRHRRRPRAGVALPGAAPRDGSPVGRARAAGTIPPAFSPESDRGDDLAERLTVGVAARLSRYLQVLTQARKMGKDRISSQEISEYTNINATQIRRDLSGFGKFGKRGVGYSIDSLLGEIRRILRTQGQHNIALVGAGRLGQAIASSQIFAEHGITIAAIFDSDPVKVGRTLGGVQVSPIDAMNEI